MALRAACQAPALPHVLVTVWGEHFDLSQVPPNLLLSSLCHQQDRERESGGKLGLEQRQDLLPSWAQQTHTGEVILLPMKQSRVMRH